MAWNVYCITPIDFGWEFLPTMQDFAGQIARAEASETIFGSAGLAYSTEKLQSDFKSARDMALSAGWEGDYRSGNEPRIYFLPSEGEFVYGFAWKQDNNGMTVVVSPQPIPWMDHLI